MCHIFAILFPLTAHRYTVALFLLLFNRVTEEPPGKTGSFVITVPTRPSLLLSEVVEVNYLRGFTAFLN